MCFSILTFIQIGKCQEPVTVIGDQIQNECEYILKTHSQTFPSYLAGVTSGWVVNSNFTDEFDDDFLNANKWAALITCHPMSPDADFSNSQSNVVESSDALTLKTVHLTQSHQCTDFNNTTNTYQYSSGYVESVNYIHYGYIEMRCYLPNEIALFPSFWMWGGIWPGPDMTDYDEIDVFEKILSDPSNIMLMQNFYHDLGLPSSMKFCQTLELNQSYVGQWVTFGVEWLPNEINYLINGQVTTCMRYTNNSNYYAYPNPDQSPFTCTDYPFAIPQKIQISLSLYLSPNPNPNLSEYFNIDYIRSYKLEEGFNYEYWPYTFSLTDFNMFKVHQSVRLGGEGHTAIIPSGENITIWGKESVILDKGFTLNTGTRFVARTITTDTDVFQ